MRYTLSQSKLTRKTIVHYECPHCEEDLKSDLEEAGTEDTCPSCGGTFKVPGTSEVKRQQAELARQQAEADSTQAAAARAKQLEAAQLAEETRRAHQLAAEQRRDPAYLLNEISSRLQTLTTLLEKTDKRLKFIQFAMIPFWIAAFIFVLTCIVILLSMFGLGFSGASRLLR
jgi:hypothetical protein